MFTLEYAKNPVYGSEDKNFINLIVKWVEFNEELPFSASHLDNMEHGRILYERALAGEFGEIGEYVPPEGMSFDRTVSTGTQTL